MPAQAKHRRPRTSPFARGLAVVGTGGAVLALPFITATTAEAASSPVAATQQDSPATYSVVAGDSLSKIAAAHSVSGGWKKLYEDNRDVIGGNPALIRPGLELTLGESAAPDTTVTAAVEETATATAEDATATVENVTAPTENATTENAPTGDASADTSGTVTEPAAKTYTDDLDGWIKESLDVMAANGIPGSYDGIYRNIMRESSGNPSAINNWDSNAAAGTPSKGLLQVIDPTFQAYHVPGTSMDSFDPVANITAACNYAADRYGSIDNVNGPY
ncbi:MULTISPECIES: LysM peptidoglycan-binding domain-containing protein [unclassified Streptomyces]|uniref:transglycosylase SLT domain-containing protein n=1 Tax=unclassified Streptomyces TaxID=2593676 RepID=UPI00081E881C|nr:MULTISPECIES: LysM peptidoglycan-binding domain-containing protein [unclassified Streptomyces]MYZ36696.1 transglycosylase SLT domain-containing protein [Streptomyces sp. SID4917]SCF85575.1 LysM domain-containing protein [Streptomyces sp. MnatMP-M17]